MLRTSHYFITVLLFTTIVTNTSFAQLNIGLWSFVKGDSAVPGYPRYGVRGLSSPNNKPGARFGNVGCRDADGNFWVWGGEGLSHGNPGSIFVNYPLISDLWKYNSYSNEWVWVNGSTGQNQLAVFGTIGVPNPNNKPGARATCTASWIDAAGNFWMFGGWGLSTSTSNGSLSDIWKYDRTTDTWTWMGGNNNIDNYPSTYGTQYVPSVTNKMGARLNSSFTTDSNHILWIYGGYGRPRQQTGLGTLNDLWKYNSATLEWTWMGGGAIAFAGASYGTKGVESVTNTPGAREGAKIWFDDNGTLWLYGGTGGGGYFSDLWKFNVDTKMWTWMAGDNIQNKQRVGTLGVSSPLNTPGARLSVSLLQHGQNLYLFGGSGFDGMMGTLNDLWKLDMDSFEWTWIKGGNGVSDLGVYGVKNLTDTANLPGGREIDYSWADTSGNLFYFGGKGYHKNLERHRYPHDAIWKYTIASNNFTWMHGNNSFQNMGVQGIKGQSSISNKPGGRSESNSWTDSAGNFWLFGGYGFGAAAVQGKEQENSLGYLNDIWKYNPVNKKWTFVNGMDSANFKGVYGQKGIFDSGNMPGGRTRAASAKAPNGNIYLMGGFCNSRNGWMNDLWEYDPQANKWRWLSGDSTSSRQGVYGVQGVPNILNSPGGRHKAAAWVDNSGNFWLFGGQGYDSNGTSESELNDLWKFDIATGVWTWVKGSNINNRFSTTVPSATTGTSNPANTPGARYYSSCGKDELGNFWLFGGLGRSFGTINSSFLAEVWKFDPTTNNWTWVNGTTTANSVGVYGTLGVSSTSNRPGARASANSWIDLAGNFWIFGGLGYAEFNSGGLSDLWMYNRTTNQWAWMKGDKTLNQYGIYGDYEAPTNINKPGNKRSAASWRDKAGNLWQFGGASYTGTFSNSLDPASDLWKFGNYQPPTENCAGSNSTITAIVAGINPQWQVSTDNVNFINLLNNPNYNGVNSQTLEIIAPPASWNGYKYKLKTATDSSNIFTLFVNPVSPAPDVSINSTNTTFTQGQQLTFVATTQNAGLDPVYQWQVNGTNVGTGSDTLRIDNLSGIDTVRVILTGSLICAPINTDTSNTIIMTQVGRMAIELTDKFGSGFTLQNPGMYLSPRAIERRSRYNIPIDSTDLPINPAYLDSIRLAGDVNIISISKWFNKVIIESTDAVAINKINGFPFVKKISAITARLIQDTETDKFPSAHDLDISDPTPSPDLANIYNYGQSYPQVHLHQGEFLHNYGFSGQGMQLAVLDAGFFNYLTIPTFDSIRINNQILGTWDFVTNNSNVSVSSSHGTHCLSTMAANMPSTFVGTAPKTSFYLYRTEDAPTETPIEEQNLAAALERADSLGVDMASISLGYTLYDSPFPDHTYSEMDGNTTIAARAADLAANKGMLVVAAIGNDGNSNWHYLGTPADGDSVMAVGAVNSSGVIGAISSYGPSSDGQIKPDVAALGINAIVANASTGQPTPSSGTSFACPNMAGLTSCLWQAYPEINNMGVITALRESATKYTTPDDRVGYGIPDMKKAFVILLKRLYSQQIQQAGCETRIKWTAKSSNNMSFEVQRKLPVDADFITLNTINGAGSFASNNHAYTDDLTALTVPLNIQYRIKMNMDTDTSFYFPVVNINHNTPCNTYTFTGNGNWDIPANWMGANIPPAVLPQGSTIIIDPVGAGECILNINQQISAGALFEVRPGKKLLVPGNLIIQ